MTSINGAAPIGCVDLGKLDKVSDNCDPGYPGICRGTYLKRGNQLLGIHCTPTGPKSSSNPNCKRELVGNRIK